MSCALEFEGCLGDACVAQFHVKRWGGTGFAKCCSSCWTLLVGKERARPSEEKANKPKLPAVPRRGAVAGDLPLYTPKPKERDPADWF